MEKTLYDAFEMLQELSAASAGVSSEFCGKPLTELENMADLYGKKAEKCGRLYQVATSNYGEKYGTPPALNIPMDEGHIKEALAFINNPTLLGQLSTPPAKGLSSILVKKVKEEEYVRFCQGARSLQLYYIGQKNEINAYASARYAVLPVTIDSFLQGSKLALSNVQENDDAWKSYPISRKERDDSIYIGDIEAPLEALDGLDMLQHAGYTSYVGSDAWLKVPFAYQGGNPFSLFVEYTGGRDEGNGVCAAVLRSIIYQVLRGMPPYLYQILYIDPAKGAAALGEIQSKLSSAVDGNAYRLEERLYHNRYRLLSVANTTESANEILKKLDGDIGTIHSLRGSMSVSDYNATRIDEQGEIADDQGGVILKTFVIFENVHGRLNDAMVQVLEKIIDCAEDCGLTLIVTSNHTDREALDDYEKCLLAKNMDHLNISEHGDGVSLKESSVGRNGSQMRYFNFKTFVPQMQHNAFLDSVSTYFRPNIQVETAVEKRIDIDAQWGGYVSDTEIEIPIGVNSRNQITTIKLGNSENAHALLSGMTGCGKSSFIHTVINGIIMRYSPDDINIWLSDYKLVEFKRYMTNTPPHIKYVGSARSMEYTFSFIDKIYAEYERRLSFLGSISSLTEYRSKYGSFSLPRIIIIVDEFHVMSNHCKADPDYKEKLGSLLKEARGVGITFFFADQTCAVGLEGLPPDGKLQLGCRMSMRQDEISEYNAVFNISNAKEVIPPQAVYEIVTKRLRKQKDAWGVEETTSYYDHNKTLFTSPAVRDAIALKSIETYGPCQDPEFVVEAERELADWEQINASVNIDAPQGETPLFLGVPTKGGEAISARIKTNFDENLISIGPDDGMQSSLLVSMVESIQMTQDADIYIFASAFDSLYSFLEPWLREKSGDSRFKLVTDEEDICKTIISLHQTMEQRRKQREFKKIYVFWIGMADLYQNFSYYPVARPKSQDKPTGNVMSDVKQQAKMLDDMLSWFDDGESDESSSDPFALPGEAQQEASKEESWLYNASTDIEDLMKEGARRAIHQFVFYPSFSTVRLVSGIKLDRFKHRIANQISNDDAPDVLGASKFNKTIEGKPLPTDVAVYSDRINGVQFMPFYGEPEAKKREIPLNRKKELRNE